MFRSHVTRAVLGALCLLTVCAGLSSTAHAAVSYVACTQNNASAFWPYSLALTKPAGTQQNDLMVITVRTSAFYASGGGPSGWTEYLDGDGPTRTYYRVAGASEPGSYTFSNLPATSATTAVIASFRGVDTSAPILGTGAQGTGSGTSVSLAGTGLTVNRDGSMRYSGLTTNGNQTASYSGMTEGCDLGAGSASASFAYEAVNAGTLAARSATISGSANWTSQTLIAQGTETAPTVTNVAPASGPTAGGTSVTITGTGFSSASAVHFGGTSASYTVDSATQITATAPAGSAGTVDVRVTNPAGQSANTAADNYTYVAAPTVSGLAPSTGPAAGGTSVVITGTNLTGASAVTFGGAAASYTVDSATQITATAPAGSGTADVRVTTVGGQSANTGSDDFTYIPAPTVTGIAPGSGPLAGGQSVVITGTNLTGATTVTFGGVGASFAVDSATQITATSPAGFAGTVDVRVTTPGGQSANTAADNYTYAQVPAVLSLAPDQGPLAGGTSVVITGTNLTGATAVTFGGTNATSFVVDSATQITATAPARAGVGLVNVRVTTPGGQSVNTPSDDYLYEDPCGGGGFDVTFPDFGFDPLTLNGLDQTGTRELTVPVADLTNLGLGWKVQIGTDRFESAGGDQLPADAARVAAVAASAVGGTCSMPSNGVTGYPITLPQNPAKVTVFNAAAGTGLGPASLDVDVELDVPASATTGTYTSTWTVDLTAAP